jgi:hypothetical protein
MTLRIATLLAAVLVATAASAEDPSGGPIPAAPPGSPLAAFADLVSYDRPGGEKEVFGSWRSPATRRLVTKDLGLLWSRARSTRENVWDADVFSGKQSAKSSTYERVRLVSSNARKAVVEADLSTPVDGVPVRHRQTYTFLKENGAWKLDDIASGSANGSGNGFHRYLRGWLDETMKEHLARRGSANGGEPPVENVGALAAQSAARAAAIHRRAGLEGLAEETSRCGAATAKASERSSVSACLGVTWAAMRIDTLVSGRPTLPVSLKGADAIEAIENEYMRLGGRYQDAYDLSQAVHRAAKP